MNWNLFVRPCWYSLRWLAELLRLHHDDWRQRRAVRRETDRRLAAFHALPPEEQLGHIHPASPEKPPGWTIEKYGEAQRRRDGAH